MASRGIAAAEIKLVRAAKHIRAIKRCVTIYAASKPHEIVKKSNRKKQLNVPKSPPVEIAVLAGEAIYQMRSALDYLAFSLIERNPHVSSINPNWDRYCEFPLWTDPLKPGQRTPIPKGKFSKPLPGIADAPFAFIESVQPYYRVGAINNALRFLAHLSNIDKHRRLNLMIPRVKQYESIRLRNGFILRGHQTLDRGAIIEPFFPFRKEKMPVYVKRHYTALVAFNERTYLGEATTLPVDYLLKLILEQIRLVIIPAFRIFLKKP
jgi:hypothetical protein